MKVRELKQLKHFRKVPLNKMIEIKQAGKPTPQLNISQLSKSKNRHFKREFKCDVYDKYSWICGCDVTNRLYCFPCLMFASQDGETNWIDVGVCDLSHLTQKIKKHECSPSHLNSILEFNMLGKVDISKQLDSGYRLNIKEHNDQVTKNRYVLSKIIDCINFCGAFELALRDHDQNTKSGGVFKGLIDFSTELDASLKDHLTSASLFKGTSKEIQDDLLDCMLMVCQDNIKKEISNAQFVAVIAEETTDISSAFQLVIVFRYILKNGQPVERFYDFCNPLGHDSTSIARCLQESLEKVIDNNPDKVISQSYDGANVMNGQHAGVQAIIQYVYKNAHFVHCYGHQLNLIVAQCTSQNHDIRVFFSNLSDITNFFSDSPQRISILDELDVKKRPCGTVIMWDFKNKSVNLVFENKDILMECIDIIESTAKQSTIINQTSSIRRMLEDSRFLFWLKVFHNIMPHVDMLFNQEKIRITNADNIRKRMQKFQTAILEEKDKMYLMEQNVNFTEIPFKKIKLEDVVYTSRTEAAKEVCDVIINQAKIRFSFTAHYSAVALLDAVRFQIYNQNFPYQLLEDTTDAYNMLDKNRLKIELEVIYKRSDFRHMSGAVSFLQFIIENNLQSNFSETYKLLLIVITIPMPTLETERCFPTLEKIRTFLKSTRVEERLSALAMLSIEKNMITNIPNFNELVIDMFASKKERTIDFVYKNCT